MRPFPTDLDQPDVLLAGLGGFWSDVYVDGGTVRSIVAARAALQADIVRNVQEYSDGYSRLSTPVLRRPFWRPVILRLSEMDAVARNYGDAGTFGGGGVYGTGPRTAFRWPIPADWAQVPVIANRTADAGVLWVQGTDYTILPGIIEFAVNPFATGLFSEVVTDADTELTVWAYRPGVDARDVYRKFGYAIGANLESTEQARNAVNAVYDALVEGSTTRSLVELISAATDAPVVLTDGEVVERIESTDTDLWVVTDVNAYRCAAAAEAVVAVGDILNIGDPVCDAFSLSSFKGGRVPADLRAIAVGEGFLGEGFLGSVVFLNENAAWTLETVSGRTKLSFPVYGAPGNHDLFWELTHAAGIASGQTLADLLDQRPEPDGEPTALALPTTVNPAEFLAANVLRSNAGLLRLRPRSFGDDAALGALGLLRKIVPPATVLLVSVELQVSDPAITLVDPGTEDAPGYTEAAAPFCGQVVSDTIGPSSITESARCRQLRGGCV